MGFHHYFFCASSMQALFLNLIITDNKFAFTPRVGGLTFFYRKFNKKLFTEIALLIPVVAEYRL